MVALKDNGDFRNSPHRPTRYELVGKDGSVVGWATNTAQLVRMAELYFPGEEQDEDGLGLGWDIRVSDKTR